MTPRTEIVVGGTRRSMTLRAVVDTGFDGYVCLPVKVAARLGLELRGSALAILADGSKKPELLFSGWAELLGERRTVLVFLTTGDALLGTGMMRNCVLAVDFDARDTRLTRKSAGRHRS